LFGDVVGGLTVAIIALPLAMALGIASIPLHVAQDLQAQHAWLSPPAMGLYTAVVAGFIISALGGSRVQVGGPTAAFIPIVFGIADKHGYEGLALATLMAGVIVVLMGLFRFGAMIKFIPYPVTTGFTAGIAVDDHRVAGAGLSGVDGSRREGARASRGVCAQAADAGGAHRHDQLADGAHRGRVARDSDRDAEICAADSGGDCGGCGVEPGGGGAAPG
jgi:hypothetical protein